MWINVFKSLKCLGLDSLSAVQRCARDGKKELGRFPSHPGGRGSLCLCQRPELPAPFLHVHHQLHPGPSAGKTEAVGLVMKENMAESLRNVLKNDFLCGAPTLLLSWWMWKNSRAKPHTEPCCSCDWHEHLVAVTTDEYLLFFYTKSKI